MQELKYISASGQTVEMDGPDIWSGTALDMRANKWDYELGAKRIKHARRRAWAPSVDVVYRSPKDLDRAQSVFDADLTAGTPGTWCLKGCTQLGYGLGFTPDNVTRSGVKGAQEIALLEGAWRQAEKVSLFPQSGDIDGTKVYPYPYPYMYGSSLGVRYVDLSDAASVAWQMVIYGHAVSPQLTIGPNVYQFDITVPAGGYLVVDTGGADPAVTLHTVDGAVMDMFDCAQRGDGPGCGAYAFERIAPGRHPVVWNDSFGVDLTLYHEWGCPPDD